jgi:GTP-sensing pleiotropic transcriptional regulator CodY
MIEYSDNILITLNSDYGRRLNGSMNSRITFDFNSILQDESDVIRCNISVLNAMIPCSFYNVNSKNNNINYGYYINNTVNQNFNFITIPEGNYNSITLIDAINNAFIAKNDTFLNFKILI